MSEASATSCAAAASLSKRLVQPKRPKAGIDREPISCKIRWRMEVAMNLSGLVLLATVGTAGQKVVVIEAVSRNGAQHPVLGKGIADALDGLSPSDLAAQVAELFPA